MMSGTKKAFVLAAIVVVGMTATACGTPASQLRNLGAHAGHLPSGDIPPAEPLRDGERFLNVSMPSQYTPAPPNGGTDEYRCFLVDPRLTEKAFVTGSQFVAQNATIVHHAIFFRVQPGEIEQAKRLDEQSPGDGWTCFGGTGVRGSGQAGAGADWIAAWAPGGKETLLDANTGYAMQPGSQIIMQMHYSLLATAGKPAGTDRSGVRLRVVSGAANLDPLQTSLVAAPVELPCTSAESGPLCERDKAVADLERRFGAEAKTMVAGLGYLCGRTQASAAAQAPTPGPTQRCDQKIRDAGVIRAVAGHMHLLGRSIKVELNPGTPQAQTLLDVPAYDFDDQSARQLATPVAVKPGDTYRVTCTHDAALRAQLPQLRTLQPRYVVWGDGTSDEMCLGVVIWSRPS